MGSEGFIVIFGVFLAVIVAASIFAAITAKKRREGFAALASRLGLSYSSEKEQNIAERYDFLNKLNQGSNRYAYNILSGAFRGEHVVAFDYHYETHSTDSKGHRQTHHHHLSFFMLLLPKPFPELLIAAEGIFSKIAQAFGYDDIDFESHEFSRKFCVRSKDKKFAYDVCHARMMEYLLANTDLSIEIEQKVLAIGFPSVIRVEEVERNLNRLIELRQLLPNYLFAVS